MGQWDAHHPRASLLPDMSRLQEGDAEDEANSPAKTSVGAVRGPRQPLHARGPEGDVALPAHG